VKFINQLKLIIIYKIIKLGTNIVYILLESIGIMTFQMAL